MINRYSFSEITDRLNQNKLPLEGVTELDSARFRFLEPSFFAAIAIHAGSNVRPSVLRHLEVNKEDRFREEDPFTDRFVEDFPIQIIANDSRFEYDINRERHRAIYNTVKDSWGLKVWKHALPPEEREISLARHDEFHKLLDLTADFLLRQREYGVIFDCHSYNFQREDTLTWYDSPKPDINVGTVAANHQIFGDVISDFIRNLEAIKINKFPLRVAENDIFNGGYVSRRLCGEHHDQMLVYAIEFKKIFMDEWSGQLNEEMLTELAAEFAKASKQNMNHPLFVS